MGGRRRVGVEPSWHRRWLPSPTVAAVAVVVVAIVVAACSPSAPATGSLDPLLIADTSGDLFDRAGQPVKVAEDCLDVIGTRVYRSGGHFTVHIELRGPVPETVTVGTFYEWDILIDSDRNAATGQQWQLIANDIGYDYLVRVGRDSNAYSQMVYRVATNSTGNINYRVSGKAIELYFAPELIGNAQAFNYVIATRKYVGQANPDSPTAADKAPNQGHATVTQ